MTWTKVDDQLHAHPKIQRAWVSHRASLGLHLLALSYAGAYLTDGHVPDTFVRAQLPSAAERRRAVAALVDAGLWERNGAGWLIHDYLDCNASRDEILARKRDASRAPGAAGARSRPRADARSRVPTRPTPDLFPQLASSPGTGDDDRHDRP